jgi:hypothetical protein
MTPPATAFRTDGMGPDLLGLSSLEGVEDPHVAHDDGEGVHEGVPCAAEQAAPTPADPADGGVGQRGVDALGCGAPGVGVTVRRSDVVVLLTGLFVHLWGDSDAHLGATARQLCRRARHARVVK